MQKTINVQKKKHQCPLHPITIRSVLPISPSLSSLAPSHLLFRHQPGWADLPGQRQRQEAPTLPVERGDRGCLLKIVGPAELIAGGRSTVEFFIYC